MFNDFSEFLSQILHDKKLKLGCHYITLGGGFLRTLQVLPLRTTTA